VPNQLSDEQIADLVKRQRLAELAFRTAQQQARDQQGGSATDIMALMEERDRLWASFFELSELVNANLYSPPTKVDLVPPIQLRRHRAQ